jgi:surface antigen
LLLRWRSIALGGWGLILLSCFPAAARTHHEGAAHGGNCVAYAREVTGIHLDGNAASWWPHAEGHYERGHKPEIGAILVFKPSGRMHVGHVAVVSQVVGAREVLVDQSNWVRGRVTKAMSVVDASPLNDWTSVKVQFGGTHGRENPTYGFIYPQAQPADPAPAIAAVAHDKSRVAEHDGNRDEPHERQVAERAKHRDAPKAADEPHERQVATRAKHRDAPKVADALHEQQVAERAKHRDDPKAADAPRERQVAAHAKHRDDAKAADAPRERQVAERAKHRDDPKAADAPHERQVAERAKHRDAAKAPDEAKAAEPAAAAPHRLAKAETAHHRPKVADAKLAYVY